MEQRAFHEGLFTQTEQGAFLIGKKCSQCGKIRFPHGKLCTSCLSQDSEDVLIAQRGTLFSYTTTYGPTATIQPPFAVGYITTEEGLRIFAPLRMEEDKPFAIGAEMELELAELWTEGDTSVTGYRYRLADKEGER